jgi:hypothetical protein
VSPCNQLLTPRLPHSEPRNAPAQHFHRMQFNLACVPMLPRNDSSHPLISLTSLFLVEQLRGR